MKKNYLWKWLAVMMVATLGIFITSCKDDDPELSVSTTDITLKGTSDYQKIAVTARHTDWTVEVLEGRDWITAGKTNNMVNVSVKENPNKDSRKGSVQISATEDAALYHIIYVTQEGGSTKLSVSPGNVSFSASGGEQNIQVTCNTEWSVRGGNDWLTVEKLSPKTIALSAKKNETTEKLETSITVSTDDGNCSETIKVTIAASEIKLSLSGLDAPFDAAKGSVETAQELKITCGSAWTISGKPDWLDISALSGTGTSIVKVWPNRANNSSDDLKATLTVRSGNESASKTVVQRAGREKACYAKPSNIMNFTFDLVMNFNCGSNTKFFYIRAFKTSALSRYTDEELVKSVLDEEAAWDRTTYEEADLAICFGEDLEPNTSYTIVTVSYSKEDKLGEVIKYEVKTKPVENQPMVDIIDVGIGTKNGKEVYGITVKKGQNGFCDKYYVWGAAGKTLSSYYFYGTIKAWYLYQEIKANPISHATNINKYLDKIILETTVGREYLHGPLSQEESISSDLLFSYDDYYIDIVAWGIDADGEHSGLIYNDRYTMTSGASKKVAKSTRYVPKKGVGYKVLQKPE